MNMQLSIAAALGTLVLAGVTACATTQTGTEPEDMSAEGHRAAQAQADAEARHAERASASSDPLRGHDNDVHGLAEAMYGTDVYDPRGATLSSALSAESDAHAHAAAQLEAYEQEQCAAFPAHTRSACPLLGTVASVQEIDGGVRLRLAEGANRAAIIAHIKCHHAFARTEGFEGMRQCPLYLRDLTVSEVDGGVELTTSPDQVDELRRRARTHAE